MGELGERTLNLSATVGTTPEKFSALSVALGLAGGNAETASRTLERLGHNFSTAIGNPASEAAKAVKALGITEDQLKKASTDLEYGLRLLAEKWVEFQDTPTKTAANMALLGRGMETLIPILLRGGEGLDEFMRKARDTGSVLDRETAEAMANTGEKIHVLSATLQGTGVQGFLALKSTIDAVIGSLTSFVSWVGSAIRAVQKLGEVPEPSDEGFWSKTGKWRTFHPTPQAPEGYGMPGPGGHMEQLGKWKHWVQDEGYVDPQHALAQELELERNRGAAFGTRPLPSTLPGEKPVVPPLEPPKKAAKSRGGGRGRAAKDTSDADARELQRELDEEQRMQEEALNSDQKIQDLKFTRYRDEINNELALGRISAGEALRQEEELRTLQWTYDQAYFQKKLDAAQGDAKQTQKLTEEQAAAYEKYMTDIQNLDAKIELANQKAAEKSAQAFTQIFDQIGSTFTSTIAGLIERTTTWQQGLQKIFDQIVQSFIKMIGDMISQWLASGLMSLGAGAGQGAGLGAVLSSALGGVFKSVFGGLFGGAAVFNIQAMDASSFAKFAKANAATFVAAINLAPHAEISDAISSERFALEDYIALTPCETLIGAAVKLRWVADEINVITGNVIIGEDQPDPTWVSTQQVLAVIER
jgi:hypothetical protein